ncbi:MAG: branched-chain amino acid aminotransferase [Clostridia bacterium]
MKVTLSQNLKAKPTDESKLGFGKIFTDHMLVKKYTNGAWQESEIVPYGPFALDPSCVCLHYGQEVFEGLKAYRTADDEIMLFRPEQNFARLNKSNDRMGIPPIDETEALAELKELLAIEKDWIPHTKGTSLYIRPFIIATEVGLGVHSSTDYIYAVILASSGSYYANGLAPVKILIEDHFVRAVKGGTGTAKTGGNYASSIVAQEVANEQGYEQVLWLDGVERKYIEEVGAMNVMFVLKDKVVTPMLSGSILDGITRKSVLEVVKSFGIEVSEERISVEDLVKAYENGELLEAFGTGTAAVISPIGELKYKDVVMKLNNGEIGELSQRIYDTLTGIQYGELEDTFGYTQKL